MSKGSLHIRCQIKAGKQRAWKRAPLIASHLKSAKKCESELRRLSAEDGLHSGANGSMCSLGFILSGAMNIRSLTAPRCGSVRPKPLSSDLETCFPHFAGLNRHDSSVRRLTRSLLIPRIFCNSVITENVSIKGKTLETAVFNGLLRGCY